MSTQKPPRDPNVTTQLDSTDEPRPQSAPKKLKAAKKSKRPWSKPD